MLVLDGRIVCGDGIADLFGGAAGGLGFKQAAPWPACALRQEPLDARASSSDDNPEAAAANLKPVVPQIGGFRGDSRGTASEIKSVQRFGHAKKILDQISAISTISGGQKAHKSAVF